MAFLFDEWVVVRFDVVMRSFELCVCACVGDLLD